MWWLWEKPFSSGISIPPTLSFRHSLPPLLHLRLPSASCLQARPRSVASERTCNSVYGILGKPSRDCMVGGFPSAVLVLGEHSCTLPYSNLGTGKVLGDLLASVCCTLASFLASPLLLASSACWLHKRFLCNWCSWPSLPSRSEVMMKTIHSQLPFYLFPKD